MLQEFKAFINRGNVVDLAVAVILGTAFGKIINSVINDIFMPPIGYVINGIDFKELKWQIGKDVSISYGNFIQNLIEFLILAFVTFLMIKAIAKLHKKTEVKTVSVASKSEVLLEEIRDLLKAKAP